MQAAEPKIQNHYNLIYLIDEYRTEEECSVIEMPSEACR